MLSIDYVVSLEYDKTINNLLENLQKKFPGKRQ